MEKTLEYFSKLLNRNLTENTQISLSSAQKSRVYSWLSSNNIAFDESALNSRFTLFDLLSTNNPLKKIANESHQISNIISLSNGIVSIGIDLQKIDELFPESLSDDPKSDESINKIFTIRELSYAQTKDFPEQTLAGIFAAKEAIIKAAKLKLDLIDIEVLPNEDGVPVHAGYEISISHTENFALAVAIKGSVNQKSNPTPPPAAVENKKSLFFGIRYIDGIYIALFVALIYSVLVQK